MKRHVALVLVVVGVACYGQEPPKALDLSKIAGIGAQIEVIKAGVKIVRAIPGGPAEKAGLKANDVITKIGDKSTSGMKLKEVVMSLRGKIGTEVNITIKREVVLKRDIIRVPKEDMKKLGDKKKQPNKAMNADK